MKTCPTLKLEHSELDDRVAIAAFTPKGRLAGKLMLEDGPKFMAVQYVHVEDEFQRCGVGTKLYEKALAIACDYGKRLSSDEMRTRFSESFWAKQVKKGRATCVAKPRRRSGDGSGIKLDDEWRESGEYWDCGRYALNEACPSDRSLAGRRKKRRRRSRR